MLTTADESIKQQLLSRVRTGTPYAGYFQGAINNAFNVVDKFGDEQTRINADTRFSGQGKRDAIAGLVRDHFAPELARGAAKVARHSGQRNASKKTALGRPEFNKTDMVAALERREARDYLRGLPEAKRFHAAVELVKERPMVEAFLSGPSIAVTGLTPAQMSLVHTEYLQTYFGDELKELETERVDIEAVAAAAEIARKLLLKASNMTETAFNQTWGALEVKVDAS